MEIRLDQTVVSSFNLPPDINRVYNERSYVSVPLIWRTNQDQDLNKYNYNDYYTASTIGKK